MGCAGTPLSGSHGTNEGRVANFAANATIKAAWPTLEPVLHEAGLPEDVSVNVLAGAWSPIGQRRPRFSAGTSRR